MIEEDAVAGIDSVGLPVVNRNPVGVEFGHRVGAAWIERSCFSLRGFLHQTIKFAGTCLVKARFLLQAKNTNGFQDT